MNARVFWTLVVLALTPAARAADLEVTGIQAVHRHGQTFVTWKDVAEGEDGAKVRYSLYRSTAPITADNLEQPSCATTACPMTPPSSSGMHTPACN